MGSRIRGPRMMESRDTPLPTEIMFQLPKSPAGTEAFAAASRFLDQRGFRVIQADLARPWGGFFVIDEAQCERFLADFFPNGEAAGLPAGVRLSPKILMVAPGQRLSWQYHHRRSEIWRVIAGAVGVSVSPSDSQPPTRKLALGESVRIGAGDRHRLLGLDGWGAVAEIWRHEDPDHPSDEADIVRLSDDYGR